LAVFPNLLDFLIATAKGQFGRLPLVKYLDEG